VGDDGLEPPTSSV